MSFSEEPIIQVYNTYGHYGELIHKAGTTCYRSEDKTRKSVVDFIEMFKKLRHMSTLEFSWFVLEIDNIDPITSSTLCSLLLQNSFIKISREIINRENIKLIISGNGRAWLELLEELEQSKSYEKEFNAIAYCLSNANQNIFNYTVNPPQLYYKCELKKIDDIKKNSDDSIKNIHDWVCIKLFNVSRGLCNELVRHRTMSYAQASTRYIDNTNFKFIFPIETIPCNELNGADDSIVDLIENYVDICKKTYSELIEKGITRDYARQVLPTGLANEIMVAGRVCDWQRIFNLRCDKRAHWEIRKVMCELRSKLNSEYGYQFK